MHNHAHTGPWGLSHVTHPDFLPNAGQGYFLLLLQRRAWDGSEVSVLPCTVRAQEYSWRARACGKASPVLSRRDEELLGETRPVAEPAQSLSAFLLR